MLVQDAMHVKVATVEAQASLSDAVTLMQMLDARRLLVVHGSQFVGIVTDGQVSRGLPKLRDVQTPWDLVYRAAHLSVESVMSREVLTARPKEELNQAIRGMLDRHFGGLPVVDETGGLLGLLTLTDVLRSAVSLPQPGWGTVRQHLSGEAVTVLPDLPLSEAAARLVITRLWVLPVVQNQVLLGVLHEQDLRAAMASQSAAHGPTFLEDQFFLPHQTVADLMLPPGAGVQADAPLLEAFQTMLTADVHGLPVMEHGRSFLGVITISDVLRTILNSEAEAVESA